VRGRLAVAGLLAGLALTTAACGSPAEGDRGPEAATGSAAGTASPNRQGVGSYNAPGVQPIATDPCPAAADALPAPATGRDALPDVRLECIAAEGSTDRVAMARLGGTPTVVNLWASWCTPCVKEMPDLERVHRAAAGKVRFLGVNTDDAVSNARARIVGTGVTYPSVADPDERVRAGIAAPGLPATLLIDAKGRIAHRQFGPVTSDQLTGLIAEHLGVRL
jgi:thiol-disulfide isomerase/thioredoxin